MNVKIDKKTMTIEIPINEVPPPSSSGKSLIVAGTGGFMRTSTNHNGAPVSVMVNATIPNPDYKKPGK